MNNNILSNNHGKTNDTDIDNLSDSLLDKVLPKKECNDDLITDLDDLKLII